ncbi:hypothetical protein P4E94_09510 [Pontiellaceae bacterium B12219]|nr:hypothetical protein [Pontiellaceae bacterium B12219]
MSLKKTVTLTALFSFAALIISAAIASLFHLWASLTVLHISLSILFGICYCTQTALELKKEKSNNRLSGKKIEWLTVNSYTAILLTGWVILGSLLSWPPFSFFQSPEEKPLTEAQIQQLVDTEDPEIPAEETKPALPSKPPMFYSGRSLSRLSGAYDLDVPKIIQSLKEVGIEATPEWTLKEIGKRNDMATESVYESILQVQ